MGIMDFLFGKKSAQTVVQVESDAEEAGLKEELTLRRKISKRIAEIREERTQRIEMEKAYGLKAKGRKMGKRMSE